MTLPTPLEMMGAPGSPYTRKMRAVLRHHRISYLFIQQNTSQAEKLPQARVPLLPTFYLPGEAGDYDWSSADQLPETVGGLPSYVGQFHAPFLLADADAIERGAERVEAEIASQPRAREPSSYQKKCLAGLRKSRARLDPEARSTVDGFLAGTSCEALFA